MHIFPFGINFKSFGFPCLVLGVPPFSFSLCCHVSCESENSSTCCKACISGETGVSETQGGLWNHQERSVTWSNTINKQGSRKRNIFLVKFVDGHAILEQMSWLVLGWCDVEQSWMDSDEAVDFFELFFFFLCMQKAIKLGETYSKIIKKHKIRY